MGQLYINEVLHNTWTYYYKISWKFLLGWGGGGKRATRTLASNNILYTITLGPTLLYLPSVPTVCYFDEAFRAEVFVAAEVLPVFLRALRPYWDVLRAF